MDNYCIIFGFVYPVYPHYFHSIHAVSPAPCHPVLYPSPEDPPLPPPTPHPRCLLSLRYTTQFIHLWTPGPGGHPLQPLLLDLFGGILHNYSPNFVFKKTPENLKYVCQQNISSNIYRKAVKFQKFMYPHQDANANMSKTHAKCPLYRLLSMRKRLSVSSRVS